MEISNRVSVLFEGPVHGRAEALDVVAQLCLYGFVRPDSEPVQPLAVSDGVVDERLGLRVARRAANFEGPQIVASVEQATTSPQTKVSRRSGFAQMKPRPQKRVQGQLVHLLGDERGVEEAEGGGTVTPSSTARPHLKKDFFSIS